MEASALRKTLQLFHALEVHQVALYRAQAALARRETDKHLLLRTAGVEAGHIDNLHNALSLRGWHPLLFEPVIAATGGIVGTITSTSFVIALKANIAIENRAMQDYLGFIEVCEDDSLRDVLWSNLMDESLHTEWFKARLENDVDQLTLQ